MATTLEQDRAAYAWQAINQLTPAAREKGKYTKLAKGMPLLVMNSGLMQTLAFLQDKNEPHHQELKKHVIQWLACRYKGEATNDPKNPFPALARADFNTLMPALFNAKPEQYQRATTETLALLRWIRQIGSAVAGD